MSDGTVRLIGKVEGVVRIEDRIIAAVERGLASAVDAASAAGAEEARDVIVRTGRVKTGRLRDSNGVEKAAQEGGQATGAFYNTAPYAIYNEFGTTRSSGIHFMELGSKAASKKLIASVQDLIEEGKK
jgi:HK97 gp10 family phage protein